MTEENKETIEETPVQEAQVPYDYKQVLRYLKLFRHAAQMSEGFLKHSPPIEQTIENLPEEEKRPPSVRAAAIAFPKTSQFLETIKGRMVPLSSSLGEPWGVLGFDDRGSIAAACSLDWKYAVRRNDLKDLVLAFPGCPIE